MVSKGRTARARPAHTDGTSSGRGLGLAGRSPSTRCRGFGPPPDHACPKAAPTGRRYRRWMFWAFGSIAVGTIAVAGAAAAPLIARPPVSEARWRRWMARALLALIVVMVGMWMTVATGTHHRWASFLTFGVFIAGGAGVSFARARRIRGCGRRAHQRESLSQDCADLSCPSGSRNPGLVARRHIDPGGADPIGDVPEHSSHPTPSSTHTRANTAQAQSLRCDDPRPGGGGWVRRPFASRGTGTVVAIAILAAVVVLDALLTPWLHYRRAKRKESSP